MSVHFSVRWSPNQRVVRGVLATLVTALIAGCASKPVTYAFSGVNDQDSFAAVDTKLRELTFRPGGAASPSAMPQDPHAVPGQRLPVFWSGRVMDLDVTVYGYFDEQERLDRILVERQFGPRQVPSMEAISSMSQAQVQDMVRVQSEQVQPHLVRECAAFAQSLQDRYGKGDFRGGQYSEAQPTTYIWRSGGNGIDLRCYVQTSNIDDAMLRALGVVEVDYRYRAFGGGRL